MPLAVKVATAIAPGFEWHAESKDYGWALGLTASHLVYGHEVRHGYMADQDRSDSIRELVDAAPTFEAFIEDWVGAAARDLALRLGHDLPPKENPMTKHQKPKGKKAAHQRLMHKARAGGKTEAAAAFTFTPAPDTKVYGAAILHPTVEEQHERDTRRARALNESFAGQVLDYELPAPKPPGPLSKFWRQYQDEEGRFIGWAAASKLTKNQVISRLVLRRKPTK